MPTAVPTMTTNGPLHSMEPEQSAVPAQLTAHGKEGTTPSAQLKKKAAKKNKKKRGMTPADAAMTVTRGFQTPTTSGGEDSDVSMASTPRLSIGSGSPALRPSGLARAISELKLHDEKAEPEIRGRRLNNAPAQEHSSPLVKTFSGDDISCVDETETYEIPLKEDFASVDSKPSKKLFAGAMEGGLRTDSPHRKMTASDFTPLKCLGKGTYGTVLLVKQHSTGRLFAQKQLKKATLTVRKRLIEQTRSERQILESVNRHPFVVKLYYAFQDRQKLYLILEYAQGGELFHHLQMERMFSEEVAAFYMAEMVLALDHLHRNLGVVYRDLKPENCLLDAEGHLLLTDFGLSKVAVSNSDADSSDADSSKCNTMQIGTIDYMAPEVVQGRPYDAAVDWWSLGALGYDLLTGAPPFASANYAKTQHKIVHGGKIPMPYYMGPDAKDLLLRLLRREPRRRLGASMPRDLATIKSHRFFRRVDWPALARRDCLAPIQPIVTDPEAAENFAAEFTDLALSPTGDGPPAAFGDGLGIGSSLGGLVREGLDGEDDGTSAVDAENPFGGFTFVASSSLLECGMLA